MKINPDNDYRHMGRTIDFPLAKTSQAFFKCTAWFWLSFVLGIAVHVLGIDRLLIVYRRLADAVKLDRHPSQNRHDAQTAAPTLDAGRVANAYPGGIPTR